MRLSQIQRDRKRSEGGVWRDFITGEILEAPTPKRFCVLVAETNNPRFREQLARQQIHVMRTEDPSGNPEQINAAWEKARRIAFAEAMLLGWEELTDDNDAPIPYSKEKARELLTNPDYWPLVTRIEDLSGDIEAYRRRAEAQALGN